MKIIHVVESFGAGVLHFVAQLTHAMPEHEHVVVHGKREDTPHDYASLFPAEALLLPWKAVTREIAPWKDLQALYQLIRLFKQQKADIIHLHSSKAGFLGRLAARLLGQHQQVIYTPHGVAFLRQDIKARKQSLFVRLEQMANACGGQVIACSSSEASCLRSHGIHASYINNAIACSPTAEHLPGKQDATTCTVVLAGRISWQKNPAWFNAIAAAFTDQPHIRFLWIGDGELRHLLTAPNIQCTGWISREQVARYLQTADIYLATSAWEGLPLSALQAMNYRLPLVLSQCIGHLDIMQAGHNGFLFRNTKQAIQAIRLLVDNREMRHQFGQASRRLLQREFNLQQMVDGYREAYKTCGGRTPDALSPVAVTHPVQHQ